MLNFEYKNSLGFIKEEELKHIEFQIKTAHAQLHESLGPGEDFIGWLNLPVNYDKQEFAAVKECAEEIKKEADVLVVIGIGGSYLGARAVIEALSNSFSMAMDKKKRKLPQVVFAGYHLAPEYHEELLDYLEDKSVYLNVISKSGTTTEPAIAFRILKEYMERRYGKEECRKRIIATTDKHKGALKQLAEAEHYRTFVVPDDVGGRYSVLTAVGLLPIAAAGFDIDKLMAGALRAYNEYLNSDVKGNMAYQYAAVRNILLRRQYGTEILVNYNPKLHYISEWWKQLYGESEGKDGKGIFPASVDFTSDLHSMGQYIQDGQRRIFETVLKIKNSSSILAVPVSDNNLDQLDYLLNKDLHSINNTAMLGTVLAHVTGQVPNLLIEIDSLNEENLGHLIYFFEKACAVSAYLNAVNPFNQEGVESYKKNMFALLDKPGYEVLSKELKKSLL